VVESRGCYSYRREHAWAQPQEKTLQRPLKNYNITIIFCVSL
jgi:hypothetical protein